MRTTVTLDPDSRLLVERAMRERGLSFTTPRDLGPARVDRTRALTLAAELEDDAVARSLAEGR